MSGALPGAVEQEAGGHVIGDKRSRDPASQRGKDDLDLVVARRGETPVGHGAQGGKIGPVEGGDALAAKSEEELTTRRYRT